MILIAHYTAHNLHSTWLLWFASPFYICIWMFSNWHTDFRHKTINGVGFVFVISSRAEFFVYIWITFLCVFVLFMGLLFPIHCTTDSLTNHTHIPSCRQCKTRYITNNVHSHRYYDRLMSFKNKTHSRVPPISCKQNTHCPEFCDYYVTQPSTLHDMNQWPGRVFCLFITLHLLAGRE